MKTLNLSIADDNYVTLSKQAEQNSMSINEYCEEVLRRHLNPPTKHPVGKDKGEESPVSPTRNLACRCM